jgi:hypothetical protein
MAILALGGKWLPVGWGEKVWTSNFSLQLGLEEEEARVNAEVEAKAKLEASRKTSTITCVKGKIIKKVTAVNPKCPGGYKSQ